VGTEKRCGGAEKKKTVNFLHWQTGSENNSGELKKRSLSRGETRLVEEREKEGPGNIETPKKLLNRWRREGMMKGGDLLNAPARRDMFTGKTVEGGYWSGGGEGGVRN